MNCPYRPIALAFLLAISTPPVMGIDEAVDESTQTPGDEAADQPLESDSYRLQYSLKPGLVLRYQTSQEITMEALVLESRKTDRTRVTQRRQFTVQDVDERGVAHVTMQYEHVRMELQSDDQPAVVFHSGMKDQEIPQLFRLTADRLKGSAARYWLLPDGRSSLATDPADDEQAADESAVQEKSGISTSDRGTFLMPLPSEPVRIGDTWKDSQSVKVRITKDLSRKVEILRTFRLQSVNDGIATIAFNSSIASSVKSPVVRAQLMQSIPRGTLEFDLEKGVMLRKQLRFDETVLNAMGENTVVSSYGRHAEELLPEGAIRQSGTGIQQTSLQSQSSDSESQDPAADSQD